MSPSLAEINNKIMLLKLYGKEKKKARSTYQEVCTMK